MSIYAGLDVSDKTTHICVVDVEGKVLRRDVVPNDPDVLAKWLHKHCADLVRVVLETGTLSTFLYHGLVERGVALECVCARHAKGVLSALLQTRAVCPRLRVLIGWSAVVMNDFKGRHFSGAVILWAVRWYCRYGISYRDLETMLAERGVDVDHSTIYRWVQRYAPEMEKRLRWYWKRPTIWRSWRVDETYIKVKGCWAYLYRAVDKDGDTIDFYLSSTRNAKAAKRFLGKALNGLKNWQKPLTINTDKAPTYSIAISALKKEGKLPDETLHRQVKYLNNVIEADHGKLKQLIRPVRGFKSLKTAYATIKGFEVMRALKKGQAQLWQYDGGIMGEVRLIERQFGIYSS